MIIEKTPKQRRLDAPEEFDKDDQKELHFKLNPTKRTVYANNYINHYKFFVQFPETEIKVKYLNYKNKPTLFHPHYNIRYVYKNNYHCPLLPNSLFYKNKLVFCTNAELYNTNFVFKNIKDIENFIISSLYNSPFHESLFIKNFKKCHNITKIYFEKWQELSKNGVTEELLNFITISEEDFLRNEKSSKQDF
jgi:hypothetical protein